MTQYRFEVVPKGAKHSWVLTRIGVNEDIVVKSKKSFTRLKTLYNNMYNYIDKNRLNVKIPRLE